MSDEYIWNMTAFLQQLPKLNAEQYKAMVASSGGHSHGGGETKPHDDSGAMPGHHGMPAKDMPTDAPHPHPPGTPAHQDKPADPHAGMDMDSNQATGESKPHADPPGAPADHHKPATKPAAEATEHRHADGTVESHPVPQP